jgi:hypothetical protein
MRRVARPLGLSVTALVRRDDAIAGVGQRRELASPRVSDLGEPVQEQDQGTMALLEKMNPQSPARRVDEALRPG